jgi:hypothetical protein
MFVWLRKRLGLSASLPEPRQLPMPFIVGAPRSGTTLLRFMLDAHSDLAIPPETGFLIPCAQLNTQKECLEEELVHTIVNFPLDAPAWEDFQISEADFRARIREVRPLAVAAGVRAFYELYAARFGKRRWGDKTPLYCLHLGVIENHLPEAHFVHIIRDGRDAALSLQNLWFSPGTDIATLAAYWRRAVGAARAQGAGCRHYLEVRYEDLVLRTEEVLRQICSFLELSFEPAMLRYFERSPERLQEHRERTRTNGQVVVTKDQRLEQQRQTVQPPDASRIFAWKHSMSQEEQVQFAQIAGDLLRELGYDA